MLHVVPVSTTPSSQPSIPAPHPSKVRFSQERDFVAPGTVLFRQGQPSAPQYWLSQGCIALSQTLADGRRQIVDIVGPGGLVGVALGDRNRMTAQTLSYCHIKRYHADGIGKICEAVGDAILRIEAHTMLLGRKTAPERVASAILDLSQRFPRPQRMQSEGRVFNLYLGRGDLADWLGLSLETVSRCFTRFKRAGLIDFEDPQIVTLLDIPTLQMFADGAAST
ncbi:Crp/Fnr family transcriptional regulator [Agrobacterium vitis]|uniref:Crp/Fnr family transcriptional regulator n=1 Tax=Agrobacterium vitis TaxID=373 RepID=UPI0008DC015E|nr:Crp/Fnr family transcriptional regulator [Agrobacterium vitis]MUO85273.1 helix-turn-helix domain-containing protein [Agrobacterium vitis]